jgi:4-amino-4-deoxy-L-arabinose transferase-like glycosyltransferase
MRYDESVTYLAFAGQSWTTVISSYTYPNNHVFHTLLVKAGVTLFGNDPWVLRLPAFVAGVAMIPLTYWVGRRLFGTAAAYLGSGLVAASGALSFYSTNARGYTMICAATLLLAGALLRLRDRPSTKLWTGCVLVTALGFWTVPVFLFPAGGLALWFALSALLDDTYDRRADLGRLGLAVVATVILTSVLYSPIIAGEGLAALTSNSFVRATAWHVFFRELSSSINEVLAGSTIGFPFVISAVLGACAVFGLVNERRVIGMRVSMAGSMYVWCSFILLITHRAPFPRVWLFFIAPAALLAAHGLIQLLSMLPVDRQRVVSKAGELSVALALALAVVVKLSRDVETSRDTGTLRDAERIATAFLGSLRPGDRVFAPLPSNGPLAFYFLRTGVDTAYLSSVPSDSSRVYLIVNTDEGFTISSRLRDPLLQGFRRAQMTARYPSAEVYRLY